MLKLHNVKIAGCHFILDIFHTDSLKLEVLTQRFRNPLSRLSLYLFAADLSTLCASNKIHPIILVSG
jgi:hypothetical protein